MSADNTIAILKTPIDNNTDFEYRVIHTQAIDNIYYSKKVKKECSDYQYNEKGDPKAVVEYFGKSPVFTDERLAHDEAFRLYDEIIDDGGFVEYGVQIITLPCSFNYYKKEAKTPKH